MRRLATPTPRCYGEYRLTQLLVLHPTPGSPPGVFFCASRVTGIGASPSRPRAGPPRKRQRAPVEDARRRYKAALTAFASARCGEGIDLEASRRDDAFPAGRAYDELTASRRSQMQTAPRVP